MRERKRSGAMGKMVVVVVVPVVPVAVVVPVPVVVEFVVLNNNYC